MIETFSWHNRNLILHYIHVYIVFTLQIHLLYTSGGSIYTWILSCKHAFINSNHKLVHHNAYLYMYILCISKSIDYVMNHDTLEICLVPLFKSQIRTPTHCESAITTVWMKPPTQSGEGTSSWHTRKDQVVCYNERSNKKESINW